MILTNYEGIVEEFGFTAPPQSLKTQTQAAAASIMYPAAMVSYTWESSTDPYNGMGQNVISAKRHAFDDYERNTLKAEIAALKEMMSSKFGEVTDLGSGKKNT